MNVLKMFYKVRLNKHHQNSRGATMTEFVITVPLMLAMLTFGFGYGSVVYTKHRMAQAAYEAVKLVPQAGRFVVVDCESTTSKSNCLSHAMTTRAKRVLEESGITTAVVRFINECKIKDPRDPSRLIACPRIIGADAQYQMLGVRIQMDYTFLFGQVLGMRTSRLEQETLTHYRTADPAPPPS